MLRLREARRIAGLSLAKVSTDVGVSLAFLQEVETGKKPLAVKHWSKLAGSLRVDPTFVAMACVEAGPVRIDAAELDQKDRLRLVDVLAALADRCSK